MFDSTKSFAMAGKPYCRSRAEPQDPRVATDLSFIPQTYRLFFAFPFPPFFFIALVACFLRLVAADCADRSTF